MHPFTLIEILQELYRRIDKLLWKHEKIDRIHHCCNIYILASGLLNPNQNHAVDIAKVAISLRNSLLEHPIIEDNSFDFKLRIGLHSGELVGCMTGGKLDRFMIFGDSVHITRQIQKKCPPGSILVSEIANSILRKVGLFTTIPGPTIIIEVREALVI